MGRPACKKCTDSNKVCEGYEKQMTFIVSGPNQLGRCMSRFPDRLRTANKRKAAVILIDRYLKRMRRRMMHHQHEGELLRRRVCELLRLRGRVSHHRSRKLWQRITTAAYLHIQTRWHYILITITSSRLASPFLPWHPHFRYSILDMAVVSSVFEHSHLRKISGDIATTAMPTLELERDTQGIRQQVLLAKKKERRRYFTSSR